MTITIMMRSWCTRVQGQQKFILPVHHRISFWYSIKWTLDHVSDLICAHCDQWFQEVSLPQKYKQVITWCLVNFVPGITYLFLGSTTIARGIVVFSIETRSLRWPFRASITSMSLSSASVQYSFLFTQSQARPSTSESLNISLSYRAWSCELLWISSHIPIGFANRPNCDKPNCVALRMCYLY